MNEKQELKMSLLERFSHLDDAVGFCRKAYEFLTEGDDSSVSPVGVGMDGVSPVFVGMDGVYLVYEDGRYCSIHEEGCKEEGVEYIGIIHDGHPFGVTLGNYENVHLLRDSFRSDAESDMYISRECDARNEWRAAECTRHLHSGGMADESWDEGEYVPTLAMVAAMFYWADRGLNAALEFAEGEPFEVSCLYLSSTEFDSDKLWAYGAAEGALRLNKHEYGSLRTVVDFPVAELKRI